MVYDGAGGFSQIHVFWILIQFYDCLSQQVSLTREILGILKTQISFLRLCIVRCQWPYVTGTSNDLRIATEHAKGSAVVDLGEGPRGPGPPLLVEYLQKIYKKTIEMSTQKPF